MRMKDNLITVDIESPSLTLTRKDSNLEPSGPEPDVLPIELRVKDSKG